MLQQDAEAGRERYLPRSYLILVTLILNIRSASEAARIRVRRLWGKWGFSDDLSSWTYTLKGFVVFGLSCFFKSLHVDAENSPKVLFTSKSREEKMQVAQAIKTELGSHICSSPVSPQFSVASSPRFSFPLLYSPFLWILASSHILIFFPPQILLPKLRYPPLK